MSSGPSRKIISLALEKVDRNVLMFAFSNERVNALNRRLEHLYQIISDATTRLTNMTDKLYSRRPI